MTAMVRENIGPANAKEWNSPRSPHGSTVAGRSASKAASKVRPANDGLSARGFNAGKTRAKPPGEHLAGKFRGSHAKVRRPHRKDRLQPSAGQPRNPVSPDVLKKEVSERNPLQPLRYRPRTNRSHPALILSIRARKRQIHLPKRQPHRLRLLLQQLLAKAMDRHPPELLVERSEQPHHFILLLLPQQMQRPGRVLPAAPTEQDASRATAWRRGHSAIVRILRC